jgi:glycosyltransferase involved in cell wall biosynthesis
MRLGIVYHMPFWRGADGALREVEGSFARYVDSLAPYFDEIALCVPVVGAPRGDGTAIRAPNVTLAPLPAFDGPLHFYPRLPAMLPRIVSFVRGIDVLHCRVPTPAAVFAFAASRMLGRPAFVLIVGDLQAVLPAMPYRGVKRGLWRAYTAFEERNVQWMANRSLAFANGAALAAKHSRPAHAVLETRTTTIEVGNIATRGDTAAGSPVRLLSVSRVDPRKGLRLLPEVVRRLADRGVTATIDVIGPSVGAPGDAERVAIETRARELDVAESVRFLGAMPLEQLLTRYAAYDGFVLPTLPGEGIPRVLLEAMSAGLPIVTTRVAGIPGLITHEVNGLLVDRPDAAAIADAIARLIDDGALRRSLIANGYRTARAHTLDAQAAWMMTAVASELGVPLRQPAATPAA